MVILSPVVETKVTLHDPTHVPICLRARIECRTNSRLGNRLRNAQQSRNRLRGLQINGNIEMMYKRR